MNQESANATQDRGSTAAPYALSHANTDISTMNVGAGILNMDELPEIQCPEDAFRQVESANNSLTGLEARHASLLKSLDDGTFDVQMLRSALQADSSDLSNIRRYQKARLAEIPFKLRPTDVSAVSAKRVLGTAELLEQIILCLDPRDALSTIQITKDSLSIFEDSIKLQSKLSLHHAEDGFLFNPFEDFESSISFAEFQVDIKTIEEHPGGTTTGRPRRGLIASPSRLASRRSSIFPRSVRAAAAC